MHILTVLDHLDPASFTTAIAEAFMDGARSSGHTTELADLNAEGFNPVWTMADRNQAPDQPPEDVAYEQERIGRADAVCLVFPLFWWGMPSVMKGWVDRVWSWGWAYDQLDDPNLSLQRARSGLLLVTAGARSDEMEDRGYMSALQTQWIDGTFGYFGFAPRRLEVLNGSTGSVARRAGLLERARQAGRDMPAPDS